MNRFPNLYPASFVLVLLVSMCHAALAQSLLSGGRESQYASAAGEQVEDRYATVVEMTDELAFRPRRITIKAGDVVLWKNGPSTVVHAVTADARRNATQLTHSIFTRQGQP